jgi:hypothetical protein
MTHSYDLNAALERMKLETVELKDSGQWTESHGEIAKYAVALVEVGLVHEYIACDDNMTVVEDMGASTAIAREVVKGLARASCTDNRIPPGNRYFFYESGAAFRAEEEAKEQLSREVSDITKDSGFR